MRLAQDVAASARGLHTAYGEAQPFPHFQVDGFFEPEFCAELLRSFPPFQRERALNEFGELGGKAVYENLWEVAPCYAELDRMLRSRKFLGWLSEATGIDNLLYDPDYVGGGTHENRDGQELDPHVDFNYHPRRRWHRRLNLILFLNQEWEASWGGCLQLHPDPWSDSPAVMVEPCFNRCVVFETSERSWHGFEKIRLPDARLALTRKSIAVYFYTTKRPPEEVAPEHGTYYVPRPLPQRFQAGRKLTPDDVSEVRKLLTRRDQQIRYLWEHERELRTVFAEIIESPSLRIGRAVTWPLRKLRDLLTR